ncbi:kinase-like protein [Amanita rubescens]|nr:kinase-like protein [Amanita rubescens]
MANPNPGADAQQQDIPHFTFSEEPLGLPASEGFGYFQGGPGLTFGPDGRFKLQAKLGFGTTSSVWLARDHVDNVHVAIKILTGHATFLNREHKLRELEVLQRLRSVTPDGSYDHCASLLTQFTLQKGKFIPVPTVKRILRHVLLGIARLHKCGIAHTDIKPDNIMIDLERHWTTETIDTWVRENPPRTYAPERSLNKMVTAFVSQSLPPSSLDALSSCNFKLADFSSAQFSSDQTTDNITPLGLRPPEVVLGGEWGESVDIWTFGCMVFTLLTRQALFDPVASAEHDASEIDVLLYQMILFCGEFFKVELLRRCSHSLDYFQLDCSLLFSSLLFFECILDSGCILDPSDMAGVTDLMTKCLRIDPLDRATALELLQHPWLMP